MPRVCGGLQEIADHQKAIEGVVVGQGEGEGDGKEAVLREFSEIEVEEKFVRNRNSLKVASVFKRFGDDCAVSKERLPRRIVLFFD